MQLKERVDDLSKRVRGLEQMEKRLAQVEKRLAKLEGGTSKPAAARKTTSAKKPSGGASKPTPSPTSGAIWDIRYGPVWDCPWTVRHGLSRGQSLDASVQAGTRTRRAPGTISKRAGVVPDLLALELDRQLLGRVDRRRGALRTTSTFGCATCLPL